MSELTVRGATEQDAPAITALLQAAEAVDHTEEHEGLEDVEEMLANPLLDLSRDWLVAEEDGLVVASAELWPRAPADGAVDVHVGGTVHPDHRGQGIGTLLLRRMLDRARDYVGERAVEAGAPLRPVIRAESITTNAAADRLLRDHGFEQRRQKVFMGADLGEPRAAVDPLPDDLTLHTWEGVDDDEIRAAHNLAFGGHHYGFTPWDEQMWQQWVVGNPAFRPASSLLLRDGSRAIAAYLQTCEYDAVTEATGVREAFVAKVGTIPVHRGRGLATRLLGTALERYAAEGYAASGLDVDADNETGALHVYERAGYRPRVRFGLYALADG